MSDESTLSVKPVASSGPAPALKTEHFSGCDEQALGRFAGWWADSSISDETLGSMVRAAFTGRVNPVGFDGYRSGCQCASLRASAVSTYQGRVRRAAAAKGGR